MLEGKQNSVEGPVFLDLFLFLLYSYGAADWRAVQRCTKIVQSRCDLSKETRDLEQGYFARVRAVSRKAHSNWVRTRRFDPKSDSKNQQRAGFCTSTGLISVKLHFFLNEDTLNVKQKLSLSYSLSMMC